MNSTDEPQEPDLEPIEIDDETIADDDAISSENAIDLDDDAPAKGGRAAVIAGVAAGVVIAGAALFAVRATGDDHAAAVSNATATTPTNSTPAAGATNGNRGGGFAGRGTAGTIGAINGSTLTVTGTDGTTTNVTTTEATTVTRSETASIGDIDVGDQVTVVGTGSSTEIAARRITDTGSTGSTAGRLGGGPGMGDGAPGANTDFVVATGTVKSIDGSTLTLTSASGSTVRVTASSATTIASVSKSTVGALAVGDQVVVNGTTTNGTVAATAIREGAGGGFPGGAGGMGGGPGMGGGTPPQGTGQTT